MFAPIPNMSIIIGKIMGATIQRLGMITIPMMDPIVRIVFKKGFPNELKTFCLMKYEAIIKTKTPKVSISRLFNNKTIETPGEKIRMNTARGKAFRQAVNGKRFIRSKV